MLLLCHRMAAKKKGAKAAAAGGKVDLKVKKTVSSIFPCFTFTSQHMS